MRPPPTSDVRKRTGGPHVAATKPVLLRGMDRGDNSMEVAAIIRWRLLQLHDPDVGPRNAITFSSQLFIPA
jgi:hypothetical protein